MTDVSLKKDLNKLGLSKNQVEIYVLLMRRGSMRISEMVEALQIPRSSIYESLKSLFDLSLAEEIIENSFKRIRPYPISAMHHTLDEKIIELQKQSSNIERLGTRLAQLSPATTSHPTIVRFYKGRAGARQMFWNTLKAESMLYVHSEWGRSRYVGVKFYQNFVNESYARDFQEHVLANPLPCVLDSIKQDFGTTLSRTKPGNIRMISEDSIFFKGDTLMYNNIYAQMFLKGEEINGFEIESQQFVDMQRAIFEILWRSAKPLSEYL